MTTVVRARNYSKLRAFLALHFARTRLGDATYISLTQLSAISRVDRGVLKVLVPKWVRWGYVEKRDLSMLKMGFKWGYRLRGRGKTYIRQAETWHPLFKQAVISTAGGFYTETGQPAFGNRSEGIRKTEGLHN